MQKWEYLYLAFSQSGYAINGINYKLQQGESLFTLMNKLGEQGWELVTSPEYSRHTFKRPLEKE